MAKPRELRYVAPTGLQMFDYVFPAAWEIDVLPAYGAPELSFPVTVRRRASQLFTNSKPTPYVFFRNVRPSSLYGTIATAWDNSNVSEATQGSLEILWDHGWGITEESLLNNSSIAFTPDRSTWLVPGPIYHGTNGSTPRTFCGAPFYVREEFDYYLTTRSSSITDSHSFPTRTFTVYDVDGDGAVNDETERFGHSADYESDSLKWVLVSRHRNRFGHRRYVVIYRPDDPRDKFGLKYLTAMVYYVDSTSKDSIYDSDFVFAFGNQSAN